MSPVALRRILVGAGSLALAASLAGPAGAAPEPVPEGFASQQLAVAGEGGHATYREPSIVQLEDGDLLAWYIGGGSTERAGTALLQRRSSDGGATWGEQTVVSEGAMSGSGPSAVLDAETGTLFVFHTRSLGAVLAVSEDGGRSWTNRSLRTVIDRGTVSEMRATGGAGIRIRSGEHAGRLVQPMTGRWPDGSVRAFALISDDHGARWRMGEPVSAPDLGRGDEQMGDGAVLELEDGRLLLQSGGSSRAAPRTAASSSDGGLTWTEPEPEHTQRELPADGSVIGLEPGSSQELLLSHTRSSTAAIRGEALTLRYTCDGGDTWPGVVDLRPPYSQDLPSASRLIALQDGGYGVLHEEDSRSITYTAFDREALDPHCVRIEAPEMRRTGPGAVTMTVTVRNDGDHDLGPGTVWSDLTQDVAPAELPRIAPGESATVELWVYTDMPGPRTSHGAVIVETDDHRLFGEATLVVEES